MCSHLQRKLLQDSGVYYPIYQVFIADPEVTYVLRSRQLHIYRHSKKILILAGKAAPKILAPEDSINRQYLPHDVN